MHLTANYRPPASRQNKLSTSRFVNCLKQITLKNKDLNWALLFSTKKSNISPRLLGLTGDYMSQTLCRMSETSKSVVGQMSPFFQIFYKTGNGKGTQTDFNVCMRHSCHCQKTRKYIVRSGQQARLTQRSSSWGKLKRIH